MGRILLSKSVLIVLLVGIAVAGCAFRARTPVGHLLLEKAFAESEGKTVDLVVDQEVVGVTPEMFKWWITQIRTRYKLWFPHEHLSAKAETLPDGRTISLIEEYVGEFYTIFRFLSTREGTAIFTADNKQMGLLVHQPSPSPNGMKLRSIFRFPAKTPQRFIDAMREHCKQEMQDLPRFLPELYRREAK